jgi:hypothetical protein
MAELAADTADLLTGPNTGRLAACDAPSCNRYLLRTHAGTGAQPGAATASAAPAPTRAARPTAAVTSRQPQARHEHLHLSKSLPLLCQAALAD